MIAYFRCAVEMGGLLRPGIRDAVLLRVLACVTAFGNDKCEITTIMEHIAPKERNAIRDGEGTQAVTAGKGIITD